MSKKVKKLNKNKFEVTENQETKKIYNIEILKENKKECEERLAKIKVLIKDYNSIK